MNKGTGQAGFVRLGKFRKGQARFYQDRFNYVGKFRLGKLSLGVRVRLSAYVKTGNVYKEEKNLKMSTLLNFDIRYFFFLDDIISYFSDDIIPLFALHDIIPKWDFRHYYSHPIT